MTLKMTTAQVVETSVTVVNSSFKKYIHPDDYTVRTRNYNIDETGRNLNTRLTEHKRATRNGNFNNNIVENYLQTNPRINWDSSEYVIYSIDYYQRLTLESWFTNLEQK